MDTRLLKIFRTIAHHRGLSRAAVELHLTPSALSHALKNLEMEVGCRLFDRSGNQLVLNQAGEHLLSGIEEPLKALERTAASVKELAQWGQGQLRVGAPASACQYLLPNVLRSLRRESPRMHLLVESGDMPHLIHLLRERRIDLAVGVEPEHAPDLHFSPLFEDELFFVLSPSHAWNDGRTLTPGEMARQTLILYQRNGPTAHLVSRYFREQGCEPSATMAVASIPGIKEMVRMNLGIGVMAPWAAESELSKGTLRMRPPGGKALKRRWVIAHLAARALTLGETRFCKLCRAEATGLRKVRKDLPSPKGS